MKKRDMINLGYSLLDNQFNIKVNTVKISVANTLEHEMAKLKKSWELIKDGHTIITEAIFKNGGRADIFVLDTLQVFEILHSETKEQALRKEDYYPESVDIFYLTSEEVLNDI